MTLPSKTTRLTVQSMWYGPGIWSNGRGPFTFGDLDQRPINRGHQSVPVGDGGRKRQEQLQQLQWQFHQSRRHLKESIKKVSKADQLAPYPLQQSQDCHHQAQHNSIRTEFYKTFNSLFPSCSTFRTSTRNVGGTSCLLSRSNEA